MGTGFFKLLEELSHGFPFLLNARHRGFLESGARYVIFQAFRIELVILTFDFKPVRRFGKRQMQTHEFGKRPFNNSAAFELNCLQRELCISTSANGFVYTGDVKLFSNEAIITMPLTTEDTTFTHDVSGRYICNTMLEAFDSTTGGGKPFDVIVIGGGSFGGVIAHRLFQLDSRLRQHRILVLEGGPFLIPEHVQNLPNIGDLFPEVKRLPWLSSPATPHLGFPGLAYCLAGRSLFWGGWSPQLTDSELSNWPVSVVKDLKDSHFLAAQRQLGTDTANDFIFGPLHDALRGRLFNGIGQVTHRFGIHSPQDLEAPLAVVSAAVRAGTFPANKFSSMPLLMDAARKSFVESKGNDRNKRLMIVANCNVNELGLTANQVSMVKTSLGDITVPAGGVVVIALGTIESMRLALRSFPNTNGLIGCNLMAHLRSNFTMRIPRRSLGIPSDRLFASSLFVKGKSPHGHFHLQITAAAAGPNETNSEAELFRKVPDIDTLDSFDMNDESVILTLRGIGEMTPAPNATAMNRVDLVVVPSGTQAAPTHKAQVTLLPSSTDDLLWKDMDSATDEIASILSGNSSYDVLIVPWQPLRTWLHRTSESLTQGRCLL